jgi:hypothetical protein
MDHEGSIGHLENIGALNSPQFIHDFLPHRDIRYAHNEVSDGEVLLKSNNIHSANVSSRSANRRGDFAKHPWF